MSEKRKNKTPIIVAAVLVLGIVTYFIFFRPSPEDSTEIGGGESVAGEAVFAISFTPPENGVTHTQDAAVSFEDRQYQWVPFELTVENGSETELVIPTYGNLYQNPADHRPTSDAMVKIMNDYQAGVGEYNARVFFVYKTTEEGSYELSWRTDEEKLVVPAGKTVSTTAYFLSESLPPDECPGEGCELSVVAKLSLNNKMVPQATQAKGGSVGEKATFIIASPQTVKWAIVYK